MKKISGLIAFLLSMVLCVSSSLATTENGLKKGQFSLTDEEWRAQKTAGQGFYYKNLGQGEIDKLEVTTIYKSKESPTGFYVTFRFKDPKASRVRICGEFTFATQYETSTTGINLYEPEDWSTDKFLMLPGIQASWNTYDMKLNNKTGVWYYTIPLPSGNFFYFFIVGGAKGAAVNDYKDAVQTSDPNNRPFEGNLGEQIKSIVRVPFDPQKQVKDRSIELPRTDGEVGISEIIYYPVKGVEGIEDGNYELLVYKPYGYDANRKEPYKVLYLSHGTGTESAASWYNKGSLANMMDNLVAEGTVEPFVVVSINNYTTKFKEDNLVNNIIPYVEAHYNVSDKDKGRAMAGLSAGGMYTHRVMMKYPEYFNYYGIFSGYSQTADFELNKEKLADARIYLSLGMQEFLDPTRAMMRFNLMYGLAKQGFIYDIHIPEGGHQWSAWREHFVDFCRLTLWK